MNQKDYCTCSIFLSDGKGVCVFCGKPMKPIKIRKEVQK